MCKASKRHLQQNSGVTAPPPQKGDRQKCSSRKKRWTAQEDEEIIRIKLKNQKINQYLHGRSNEYLEELESTSHRNFSTPSSSDLELVFYFIWNYILFFYNFVRTQVYIPVFLVRI